MLSLTLFAVAQGRCVARAHRDPHRGRQRPTAGALAVLPVCRSNTRLLSARASCGLLICSEIKPAEA
eukprot:2058911-Rhodomonas_salina.1